MKKTKSPKALIQKQKIGKQGISRNIPYSSFALTLWFIPIIIFLYGAMYLSYTTYSTSSNGAGTGFGEVIAIKGGFGWDGLHYGLLANDFPNVITSKKLDSYRAQRIIPSGIVYSIIKLRGWEFNNALLILKVFQWYHVVLLTLSGVLWVILVRTLNISVYGGYVGAILLYVNYGLAKYYFYNAALTDLTAFCLILAMIVCYFRKLTIILIALTSVGFFTWPLLLYQGIILILFPYHQLSNLRSGSMTDSIALISTPNTTQGKASQNTIFSLGAVIMSLVSFGIGIWYYVFLRHEEYPGPQPEPIVASYLPLSIGLFLFWIAGIVYVFTRDFPITIFLRDTFTKTFLLRISIIVIMVAILILVKENIQNSALPAMVTTERFIGGNLSSALSKPLISIVAHSVFLGGVFTIIILLPLQTVRCTYQTGLGNAMQVIIGLIFMGLVSESRQTITFLPSIVLCAVLAVEQHFNNFNKKKNIYRGIFLCIIFSICALSTKLWMPINFLGMGRIADDSSQYGQMPFQKYFMNHGPWINMENYTLQGAIFLGCLILIAISLYIFQILKLVKNLNSTQHH